MAAMSGWRERAELKQCTRLSLSTPFCRAICIAKRSGVARFRSGHRNMASLVWQAIDEHTFYQTRAS